MNFDLKYLDKLAKLMKSNQLNEVQLEDNEQLVILRREKEEVKVQAIPPQFAQSQIAVANKPQAIEEASQKKGRPMKSPMVGTFYRASSPDAPPFVEVGSLIAQGESVCIIEAMKLMNEIESDYSGKVLEICVENGQPVEYGQVLMYIE